jgi:hypothetical protein
MGLKRDKYDEAVSNLVRLRSNFTCEKCGVQDEQGQITFKSQTIHCSHFNGRGSGITARYDTDNCRALCASCHSIVEHKPGMHTKLLQEILGERGFELMEERCHGIRKMYKSDKEEMLKHYRSEFDRLKQERMNGNVNYIEVVNYF